MASREEMLAEIQRLEEAQAIEAELAKRKKAQTSLPEWMTDLMQYGPGFLGEQGQNILRGAGNLAAEAPRVFSNAVGLPNALLGAITGKGSALPDIMERNSTGLKNSLERNLPIDPNETPAQARMRRVSEGAGAGLLGAPALSSIPAAAAAGGISSLGAEGGGNFAERLGVPRTAGELAGGLLTGGATGFLLGPKLSAVQDDLSRASRGLTPQQIAEALAKQKVLDRGGAQSAVLADTLPAGSPLRSLTERVRASEMGNPVALKTQGREADLAQLGQRTLDSLGPQVEPAKIATQLSDSANDFLLGQKGLRSAAIENRLSATPAPKPVEIFKLYRELAAKAKDPKNPSSINDPYAQVAKELLNADGSPITDPQKLSFQIKQLKARDANPMQQNSGGSQIAPGFLKDAIAYTENRLGQIIPDYRAAMDEFRAFSRRGSQSSQTLGDLQNSPIRRMADTNPSLEAPTPASKLGILASPENAPSTSAGIARLLSNSTMTQGRTVDPAAVLRGNLQMRLADNPAAVGKIVGGPMEQNIAAVLQAVGKNADDVLAPARAAKELEGSFRGAPNIAEVARMHPMQAAIRLLRTADMTLTRAQQLRYAEEMGKILAQPAGKEVFAELQRLAAHDPVIRQQLATLVPLMGLSGSTQQ